MVHLTSKPPQNLNHILEAADGSDNHSDPATETISVDDDNKEMEDSNKTNLGAAGECAETGLGMKFHLISANRTNHNKSECLAKDWVSPINVFFRNKPWVENIKCHHAHMFECASGKC